MSEEEVIYTDNQVSISTSRIVLGATTYALRNITSVKMTFTPAKRGCAILLLIFGALTLLIGLGKGSSDGVGAVLGGLVVGGIIGGLGYLWMRSSKDDYHVLIASSSGEAKALTSKDKAYIEKIVTAINDAIVRYR